VFVEDVELLDAHDVVGELDAGIEPGVRDAAQRDAERAVADVDVALEVGILSGPGHAEVGLQRAGHVRHLRREPLDEAEADGRRRDVQVDLVATGRRDVAARARLEERSSGAFPWP
jgi:hypothetical protein